MQIRNDKEEEDDDDEGEGKGEDMLEELCVLSFVFFSLLFFSGFDEDFLHNNK